MNCQIIGKQIERDFIIYVCHPSFSHEFSLGTRFAVVEVSRMGMCFTWGPAYSDMCSASHDVSMANIPIPISTLFPWPSRRSRSRNINIFLLNPECWWPFLAEWLSTDCFQSQWHWCFLWWYISTLWSSDQWEHLEHMELTQGLLSTPCQVDDCFPGTHRPLDMAKYTLPQMEYGEFICPSVFSLCRSNDSTCACLRVTLLSYVEFSFHVFFLEKSVGSLSRMKG